MSEGRFIPTAELAKLAKTQIKESNDIEEVKGLAMAMAELLETHGPTLDQMRFERMMDKIIEKAFGQNWPKRRKKKL